MLPGALVLYLVHCFVVMKPVTPLRPGLRAWVKPPSPLLGENVGFRVFWARIGDGSFIAQVGEASSGAVGFIGQLGGGSSGGCSFMRPT